VLVELLYFDCLIIVVMFELVVFESGVCLSGVFFCFGD